MGKGCELIEWILMCELDLDFFYFFNDMIGVGGLFWCLEKGYDIFGKLGFVGFNGVDLLDGLLMWLVMIDVWCVDIGCCVVWIVLGKEVWFESGVIVLLLMIIFGDMICKF